MIRRSTILTVFLVIVVMIVSFIGGAVAFNFIMAHSVRHGEEIAVPQLKGLPMEEAAEISQSANLKIRKVGERFSVSVPPGIILEQNPVAARRVKEGRRISVIVSGGRETVLVPDLVGRSAREAIVFLDGAGLELGRVARASLREVEPEMVIATTPEAGRELESGGRVDLLVSDDPPLLRFLMPDLRGRDADRARRYLEDLGTVVLRSKEFRPGRSAGPWSIVEVTPSPGHMVSEGDTVKLVLGVR